MVITFLPSIYSEGRKIRAYSFVVSGCEGRRRRKCGVFAANNVVVEIVESNPDTVGLGSLVADDDVGRNKAAHFGSHSVNVEMENKSVI